MYTCAHVFIIAALATLTSFDPAEISWTVVSSQASGTTPAGRIGAGLAACGARLFLFGGFDGTGLVSRLERDGT
jgi:hypothetical protein